jgi:glycolate oxidase
MLVSFDENEKACAAVSAIFRAGVVPSALEFMERKGVEWVLRYDKIPFDLKPEAKAFLLIEVDGNDIDLIAGACLTVREVLTSHGCLEVVQAETPQEKDNLWRIRRVMPVSVKSNSVYKEEDTVVPRAELPRLLHGVKEVGKKYGFKSVCYGHAGDGNLHVNIIKGDLSDEEWNGSLKKGITEIFELVKSMGGTISGEHGIGLVQKEYMPILFNSVQMRLMQEIKRLFDPNNILNAGKIFG